MLYVRIVEWTMAFRPGSGEFVSSILLSVHVYLALVEELVLSDEAYISETNSFFFLWVNTGG